MQKRYYILFIALALVLAFCASKLEAQTLVVSATVQDSTGQAFANGTYRVEYVKSTTTGGFANPVKEEDGQLFTDTVKIGSLDAAGAFSVTLHRTDMLLPRGGSWRFTICPAASAACFSYSSGITGAAPISLSSQLTAAAGTIKVLTSNELFKMIPRAYNDAEIVGAQVGSKYYNLTTGQERVFNGSIWVDNAGISQTYVDNQDSGLQTQINTKAADNAVLHKTGDETSTGAKGFSQIDASLANGEYWATSDIQTAINALPAGGGKVKLRPNKTYSITCGLNQVNTGTKVVEIEGAGETSVIQGNGCKLVTLASTGSTIKKAKIVQDIADAATVGVYVSTDTTTEVTRFVIEDVYFESTNKFLGSAIKTRFGLEGIVRGGEARGWNCGVELTSYDSGHRSNANHFTGFKARWGKTGFCIPTQSIDNVFIEGGVIEGNSVAGIDASSGSIYVDKTHLEQNGDATHAQVELKVDARLVSKGVFYGSYPINTNMDIRVANGNTSPQASYSDILNDGITHNGSALFVVTNNIIPYTSTGIGTIVNDTGTQRISSNANSAYVLSGFAYYDFRGAITNTVGNTRVSAYVGKVVTVDDYTGANKVVEFYPSSKTLYTFGPVTLGAMNSGNAVLCQKPDKNIGHCSTAVAGDGTCTCI